MDHPVKCTNCGTQLEGELATPNSLPCPNCGSLRRTIMIHLHDTISIKDSIRMKAKKPGSKKASKEIFTGSDQHRKSGKWYHKERLIDRESDHYKEVVTDSQTGDIIHTCEEPLSKHQGHGSASKD